MHDRSAVAIPAQPLRIVSATTWEGAEARRERMRDDTVGDITLVLRRVSEGDKAAERELYDLVHGELEQRAHHMMRRQPAGHSLQTAGLVSEVYLRLTRRSSVDWAGSDHFFSAASRAMRHVLVDHARRRRRKKRKGEKPDLPLDEISLAYEERAYDLLDLDQALERLAARDAAEARVVELRFFAGLSLVEVAKVLRVGLRTVERDWAHARAWLHRELS